MLAASPTRPLSRRPVGRPALALLATAVALLAAVAVFAAITYAWPASVGPAPLTIEVGNVDDYEPGTVTPLWDGDRFAAHLVRLEDGTFLAFDRHDPVHGCTLPWRPIYEAFKDPCHGSEYDIAGQPSPENAIRLPMTRLDLRIDRAGDIRVTLPAAAPGGAE